MGSLRSMKDRLEPDDERQVEVATGSCALHDFAEAANASEQVRPAAAECPRVLEMHRQICANLER